MSSILGYHLPILRGVADSLGLETMGAIARQPGVQGVYRVTVHYFDRRASDSVATLERFSFEDATLELQFQRVLRGKALKLPISGARYETFVKALQGLGFDHMDDQPDLPNYSTTDVWLIERAAGTFAHSVIAAPELAKDSYARLVNAVKNGLPEALQQVK